MTEKTDIAALRSEAANIIGLLTASGHETFSLDKTADFFDDVFRLLEAERWNVGVLEGVIARKEFDAQQRENASLRGEQEPVAWIKCGEVTTEPTTADVWIREMNEGYGYDVEVLCKRQPKPVVVLSDCDIGAVSHMAHWYTEEQCEAWVAGVEHAKKQMLAAGIVVKGGE